MKAYIVRTGRVIEPFGEPACDCLVLNRTLAETQVDALTRNGVTVVHVSSAREVADPDEHLLVGDNVFFTPELLAEFIRRSRDYGRTTACALKNGVTTQRMATSVQDVAIWSGFVLYNLRYIPQERKREPGSGIVIDPDEFLASIRLPRHMCGAGEYLIPTSDKLIVQIDHWANLWVANILAILSEGARLRRKSFVEKLWLAVRAGSFNRWNILWHLNKIGKKCDIHPTAYVEGSTLGNNVIVGAGAVIRASVIGDNVTIGNGVVVEESVIGRRSTILKGHVLYSVFYPGVFSFAEMVSASFLGQDVFIGSNVTLTDFRLDGKNVTVMQDGKPVDSGNLFLGSCVGHRTRLGSGTIVVPGRMIPCDSQIVARWERTVSQNLDDLRKEGPLIGR